MHIVLIDIGGPLVDIGGPVVDIEIPQNMPDVPQAEAESHLAGIDLPTGMRIL